MKITSIVKLYNADSLEYAGSIEVRGNEWSYAGVTNKHLMEMTRMMPIKGVLSSLINFNLVYDIFSMTDTGETEG